MNEKQLLDRLYLLAERRLMNRPGAVGRLRAYVESGEGESVWRRGAYLQSMVLDMAFNRVQGPSSNDRELLDFIDQWAASHTSIDDVEPLPSIGRTTSQSAVASRHADNGRESAQAGHAAPVAASRFKKKALVLRNVPAWPTVEADLREGSRNGLTAAAYDHTSRAWIEPKALEWAQSRGKLPPEKVQPLPSVFHRLAK